MITSNDNINDNTKYEQYDNIKMITFADREK